MGLEELSVPLMWLATLPVLCLSATFASGAPAGRGPDATGKVMLYVGGQVRGKGAGIYRYHLDLATGAMTPVGAPTRAANPFFLALHPSGRFLFAVNEMGRFRGTRSGAVSAFAIDPRSGELTPLNQQPSGGPGPCHLTADRAGKHVLAANYGGGSVCVLPIGADGRLGEATAFVQHKGKSVDPRRQAAPHAHSINVDAADRFAFAADLGLDKIMVYRFDAAKGTLTPNEPPFAAVAPGAGPRHFAFHPTGRFAYVINELSSTVTAFAYAADRGALTQLETLTTLPRDFKGQSSTAEVLVHPSGKFLYGSNRGHDSIAIFAVDADAGTLSVVGHEPTQGRVPRNVSIDPSGTLLLVANRGSDRIVVFRIDPTTGALKPTGHVVQVPAPMCMRMLRLAE